VSESASRIHQPYYRNGPPHRDGADVSFHDIVKIFGFRTVTIGKWVTAKEQQIAANLFFDALFDLLDILAVPTPVISLNSSLSLAFGHGGRKHSNAHYASATRTLALAKNAGGGALAHEWFHAFDHYIARKLFSRAKTNDFASNCWLRDVPQIEHGLNTKLSYCFETIFLMQGQSQVSALVERSARADKALKSFYYAQPEELAARSFEAFIQDQPRKNAFLVQGTKQSPEAKLGIYPQSPQRQTINLAFAEYFRLLGMAVQK
jgi:hypothetical protein